ASVTPRINLRDIFTDQDRPRSRALPAQSFLDASPDRRAGYSYMMIRVAAVVLALCLQEAPAPLPSKGKGGAAGETENELKVGDKTRLYRLVVPEGLDPAKPVPLVFVFHGKGDSKNFISIYSGFEAFAKKTGFIAVFPGG